jgi:HPt (histidine-containing phosphotransfer) domain-containing protein
VLNVEAALERLDGEMALMEELLGMFLSEAPRRIEELSAAISARDAAAVQRVAHLLKGASANLCAERTAEVSYNLEEAARSGDWEAVVEHFRALRQAVAELEAETRNLGCAAV